jgi:Ca2+-binding RTX toxin-like protein
MAMREQPQELRLNKGKEQRASYGPAEIARPRSHAPEAQVGAEILETRILLTVTMLPEQVVEVVGEGTDTLIVNQRLDDATQVQMLDFTLNGNTTTFPRNDVRSMTIRMGGGHDYVGIADSVGVDEDGNGLTVSGKLGRGDDTYNGGNGNIGNESIKGGPGADWMRGGPGNSNLVGKKDNDTLVSGLGIDTLTGGVGADRFEIHGSDDVADVTQEDMRVDVLDAATVTKEGSQIVVSASGEQMELRSVNRGDKDLLLARTSETPEEAIALVDAAIEKIVVDGGPGADIVNLPDLKQSLTVHSHEGDDFIRGGTGNDSLDSGAGNDTVYGQAGDDSVFAGDGADSVFGGEGNDELFGEGGNDRIDGEAGADLLRGGEGDDILFGGEDILADKIDGQSGTDSADERINDVFENVESGTRLPKAQCEDGIDGDGDGLIDANDPGCLDENGVYQPKDDDEFNQGQTVPGGGGDDGQKIRIERSGTSVTVQGTSGNDQIAIEKITDGIRVHDLATDVIIGEETGVATLLVDGKEGADLIRLETGSEIQASLFGGRGSDTLIGGEGNDFLGGEEDDDSLSAGAGDDTVNGGQQNDRLDLGTGTNTGYGGEGDDTVVNRQGDDLLFAVEHVENADDGGGGGGGGEAPKVTAEVLNGVLTITGTPDADTITVTPTANAGEFNVVANGENLGDFANVTSYAVEAQTGDDFVDVSQVSIPGYQYGDFGHDTLVGGSGNDSLYGAEGNDVLFGRAGNDDLRGGQNDDTLNGGTGTNNLVGGSEDTKDVQQRSVSTGEIGDDTVDQIEEIQNV